MACYFSPGPLCDRCEHCNIQKRPVYHRLPFKPISISPVTGITFEAYKYSANQLADGFEKVIQGHMDSEIKTSALARWDELVSDLLDGPVWRDAEFDLKDSFHVLDDFLFMRALQHRCRVEWVDECDKGLPGATGRCELAVATNEGPICWIQIRRPTFQKPWTVWAVLETLMHEMCHALFTFKCYCSSCICPLTLINGDGLDWHGPSWVKLRRCVEGMASLYLDKMDGPFSLYYYTETEAQAEEKKVVKMLSGLYKKVTRQGSESAELKRVARAERCTEKAKMLVKSKVKQDGEEQLDLLACAGAMFEAFERERLVTA